MANRRAMQLWHDALLSGNFKQGSGFLARRRPDDGAMHFCCLGVVCELAIADGVPVERMEKPATEECPAYLSYDGADSFLPRSVAEWLGVFHGGSSGHGTYDVPLDQPPDDDGIFFGGTAMAANDGFKRSFKDIAAAIKHTYLRDE